MANEEQLSILRQGIDIWNLWRAKNPSVAIDLSNIDLNGIDLSEAFLDRVDLSKSRLRTAKLIGTNLTGSNLEGVNLAEANLTSANLSEANLNRAVLQIADLKETRLSGANLREADLRGSNLNGAHLKRSIFSGGKVEGTIFSNLDLSNAVGLEDTRHSGPSSVSTDTFILSRGKIPEVFLRGCGLSDWEIESVKLYNPELKNEEKNGILYTMYELLAGRALQISNLFISYSHANNVFVDKLEGYLNSKGIRFWRDIHDLKSGRIETQVDRAIRQNPTVLLILSKDSLNSDWVEHEVNEARKVEKETGRDVLCPIALDDSWKESPWPKRVMEQVMEYNILDFSEWRDDSKFGSTFQKLIDGLGLFYKG